MNTGKWLLGLVLGAAVVGGLLLAVEQATPAPVIVHGAEWLDLTEDDLPRDPVMGQLFVVGGGDQPARTPAAGELGVQDGGEVILYDGRVWRWTDTLVPPELEYTQADLSALSLAENQEPFSNYTTTAGIPLWVGYFGDWQTGPEGSPLEFNDSMYDVMGDSSGLDAGCAPDDILMPDVSLAYTVTIANFIAVSSDGQQISLWDGSAWVDCGTPAEIIACREGRP